MTDQQIHQELAEFLVNRFPNLGDTLNAETSLIESGAVDSLGILEIVSFLGEQYSIEIGDEDFLPENFESLSALTNFVVTKKAA